MWGYSNDSSHAKIYNMCKFGTWKRAMIRSIWLYVYGHVYIMYSYRSVL